ncbi:hypothetical protein Q5762_32685 [Streptomyces sp. P9(2023)]|nr:hypothetical protein [Streptomyces sp. P9(2023)]MDT9692997.1 hypothetical protein [Streptomyces sp. P9(2023)]
MADSPSPGTDPGRPRWVTAFIYVAIALVLVFVIVHVAGGGMGGHG